MNQDWREQLRRLNQEGGRPRRQGARDDRQGGKRGGGDRRGRPQRQEGSGNPASRRPVYDGVLGAIFQGNEPPAGANLGLVYDRYADSWSDPPDWKPAARHQFLNEMVAWAQRERQRLLPLLTALAQRRERLWRFLGAQRLELVLSSPLVSGTGMTHALTAGFVWDRNLGVPYMPGSSLKGAVRAWADPERWQALDDPAECRRIFGDLKDTGAGSVVFHDLYPLEPPTLRVDLINPHFKEYYQQGRSPGDWLEPEPAFFLTVAAGARFVTALHPRGGTHANDLDIAARCVREALEELGLGAKTAIGYGRFLAGEESGTD